MIEIPEEPPNSLGAFNPQTPPDANSDKFFCDLCKVGAPSQSQIDMHLNGKNHKVRYILFRQAQLLMIITAALS